jgi:Tol biopolymer transport system component
VSPDGSWLVFESVERRVTNIWIYNLSGTSAARPFTFGGNNRYPVWAADSRRIYFQSDREGDRAIFAQSIDGGTADKLTTPEAGLEHVPKAASLTEEVLLLDVRKGNDVSLWTLSLRDRTLSAFSDVRGLSIPTQSVFSPDGRWVAYQSGDFSANVTFVEPMPPSKGLKFQIGTGGRPLWSRDGTELFIVQRPGEFAAVGIKTQPSFASSDPILIPRAFGVASPTDLRPFDVTRDGRFVVAGPPGGATTNASPPQINVVLNWFEELKRLVPVGR